MFEKEEQNFFSKLKDIKIGKSKYNRNKKIQKMLESVNLAPDSWYCSSASGKSVYTNETCPGIVLYKGGEHWILKGNGICLSVSIKKINNAGISIVPETSALDNLYDDLYVDSGEDAFYIDVGENDENISTEDNSQSSKMAKHHKNPTISSLGKRKEFDEESLTKYQSEHKQKRNERIKIKSKNILSKINSDEQNKNRKDPIEIKKKLTNLFMKKEILNKDYDLEVSDDLGNDLSDLDYENLKLSDLISLSLGALNGLKSFHKRNLSHGDLKMENVLFDKDKSKTTLIDPTLGTESGGGGEMGSEGESRGKDLRKKFQEWIERKNLLGNDEEKIGIKKGIWKDYYNLTLIFDCIREKYNKEDQKFKFLDGLVLQMRSDPSLDKAILFVENKKVDSRGHRIGN